MGDYSLMSDYDECVRNMNNYGVNATGVIFPATEVYSIDEDEVVNDKKYVTAEEYREKYKEYSTHSISIYNKRDHFYTFPIFVPDAGNCNYEKWMELFEKNNKIGIEIIKEIIECEHEKIKKNIETNLL
ncbi:MAG: hypothetical protein PUE12_13550, partial [Oscillospiraceae bacterium]|nr:hypothetical protein [Oscillospiraceae bacterium]